MTVRTNEIKLYCECGNKYKVIPIINYGRDKNIGKIKLLCKKCNRASGEYIICSASDWNTCFKNITVLCTKYGFAML